MEREELLGRFGLYEYENLAFSILEFQKREEESIYFQKFRKIFGNCNYNYPVSGIDKPFSIEDITDNPSMFAAFAASGFLINYWFPKGLFFVSSTFKERLK